MQIDNINVGTSIPQVGDNALAQDNKATAPTPKQTGGKNLSDLTTDELLALKKGDPSVLRSLNTDTLLQIKQDRMTQQAQAAQQQAAQSQQGAQQQAQPVQQQPAQPAQQQQSGVGTPLTLDKITSPINAIGGGAQQTLANSVKSGGGLIGDIVGSVSPTMGKNISEGSKLIGNALQPPQIVQSEMQKHPTLTTAGNVVGGTMAMAATGAGAEALAAKGIISAASAPYVANAVIGAATSGKGLANRAIGAASGVVLTKAANIAGKAISGAVNNVTVPKTLKDFVSNVTSRLNGDSSNESAMTSVSNMWQAATAVRDKLYGNFKNVAGDVNATSLKTQAMNTVNDYADVMTPGQKGAFNFISAQADNVKNLDDLHEVTKSFNDMRALFLKSGTAPDVQNAFKDLKTTAQGLLSANAEKLGVGDALTAAQKYNKDIIAPLQEIGADKIARGEVSSDGFLAKFIKPSTAMNPEGSPEALGNLLNAMDSKGREIVSANLVNRVYKSIQVGADGVNPVKGVKQIQDYINMYGEQLGSTSVNELKGMQKILQTMSIKQSSASLMTLAGGVSHPIQAALAVGQKLLDTPITRPVLQFIGEHPQGAALFKKLVASYLSAGVGNFDKSVTGQSGASNIANQLLNK